MPLSHVATKYGLGWHTVRRAETDAIVRWEATRPPVMLRMLGIDEKYLGRRNRLKDKFITIFSNLENGEPIWIGQGRREDTVKLYLDTLSIEQKAALVLVAMDMHRPFYNAIKADRELAHVQIVHDPFHVMKRAGEALTELRRETFFRAGAEMRTVGRATRWLVLRAWERCSDEDRTRLRRLFSYNGRLARAYQSVEALRLTLREAPDGAALRDGLHHILRRTEKRTNVPMRKLHDSLLEHWDAIIALGEHRPPAGRIEALNNNWETMVRRGRGYRNLDYLLRKLRFVIANPVRNGDGIKRFLALGLIHTNEAA
jgi:transposase